MDHKKKKGGAAGGGKPKPSTSKNNTNKKIEVQRHFDPRKTKSKRNNNFPEILLDEPETILLKAPKTVRVKKRNTSFSNLKPNPKIKPRHRSCSCEKKEPYFLDSYMSSQTSTNQFKTTRNLDSQAHINTSNASVNKEYKNQTRQKPELIYKTLSNNSSHISVTKDPPNQARKKPSTTPYRIPSPKALSTGRPTYQNEEFFCKFKDPVVQQLKYEIGLSKAFCSEEVKNTVVELKAEIAKYRQTLNKNVNLLQGKLDPTMFARNASVKESKQMTIETQTDRRDDGDDVVRDDVQPNLQEVDQLVTALNGLIQDADHVSGAEEPLTARKATQVANLERTSKRLVNPSNDKGTNNPKLSLNTVADKSIEVDYLQHQKENIEKVDYLIIQAEKSLKAIKREFYSNIDGCLAPPGSQHSSASTMDEEDSATDKNLSIHSSHGDHATLVPSNRNDVLASKDVIIRLINLKCKQSSQISLSEKELSNRSSCTKSSSAPTIVSSEQLSSSKIVKEILDKYDVTSDSCCECFQTKKKSLEEKPAPAEIQPSKVGRKPSGSLKSSSCLDVLERPDGEKPILKQGSSSTSFFSYDGRQESDQFRRKIRSRSSSQGKSSIPERNPPGSKISFERSSEIIVEPLEGIQDVKNEDTGSLNEEISDDSDCSCPVEEIAVKFSEERFLREMDSSTMIQPSILKTSTQDDDAAYLSGSEARLNTISERTEIEETDIVKKPKEVKLTVQHMPLINIRPPLQFQKVFQIDIKPALKPKLSMSTSQNVCYKELKHEESLSFWSQPKESQPGVPQTVPTGLSNISNDPIEVSNVYLDVVSPIDVVLGIEHPPHPVDFSELRGEVLRDVQGNVSALPEAGSSKEWLSMFSRKGQSVVPSVEPSNVRIVSEEPQRGVSKTPEEEISGNHHHEVDFPEQISQTEPDKEDPFHSILISKESDFQYHPQPEIICMSVKDEESWESPSSLQANTSRCPSMENITYVNKSFKQNSESFDKLNRNVSSEGLTVCPCTSVCLVEEGFSDSSASEKNNVRRVESTIKSDTSSESIYLITHDVATQISNEDFPLASTMMKPLCSADCSIQNSKVRVAVDPDSLKALYERNTTEVLPKIQERIEDPQKKVVKASQKDQVEKKTQETQTILNMVGVQYENKEVQKSMEESSYGYAKLHKAKTCTDYETSSNDSNTAPKVPLRNIPFGDALPTTEKGVYKTEDYASTSTPELTQTMKNHKKAYSSKQSSSSSNSEDYHQSEDTMSDGEVKCKCSVSIGELHLCRFANDIKTRANYLKKHPEQMLQRDLPGQHVEMIKQRAHYDNWISYTYTSSSASPDSSGISRET